MIEIVKTSPLVVRDSYYHNHELTLYRSTILLHDETSQDVFFLATPEAVRRVRNATGGKYYQSSLPPHLEIVRDDKHKVLLVRKRSK